MRGAEGPRRAGEHNKHTQGHREGQVWRLFVGGADDNGGDVSDADGAGM